MIEATDHATCLGTDIHLDYAGLQERQLQPAHGRAGKHRAIFFDLGARLGPHSFSEEMIAVGASMLAAKLGGRRRKQGIERTAASDP
jgi:hypothetical protein